MGDKSSGVNRDSNYSLLKFMRSLKILFISLGILSSIYVLIWDTGKHKLRESGIEYVHTIVYFNPILKSRIGDITIVETIKNDGENIGNKYYLRIHENVRTGEGDNMAVTVVVYEKGEWTLWSFILMRNGKSEQFVDYGQFK